MILHHNHDMRMRQVDLDIVRLNKPDMLIFLIVIVMCHLDMTHMWSDV